MVDKNKLSGKIVEAGYSKTRLASEMEMSKNTLCDKINGKRPFNTDEVIKLCKILKIVSPVEKVEIFLAASSHF